MILWRRSIGRVESQTFEGRALAILCWYRRGWERIPTRVMPRLRRSRYYLASISEGVR